MTVLPDREIARHLDRLTEEDRVLHAVLFTTDGMLKACSTGLDRDSADRVAASLSGVMSLSQALGEFCGDGDLPWVRSVMEFADHTVLIVSASDHTCVGVAIAAPMHSEATVVAMRKMLGVVTAMASRLGTGKRVA